MQTGNTSSPSVRFSSTIRFVSRETAEKIATSSDVTPVGDIETAPSTYTKDIIMCNGGGVTGNKDTGVLFHFNDWDPIPEHLEKLTQHTRQFSQSTPNGLRALIIGGQSHWESSQKLGKALQEFFKARKIPVSILWGHRRHDELGTFLSNIAYSAKDDTWTVFTRTNRGSHVVNSPQRLKEAFEKIELYRGDKTQTADVITFEKSHRQ